MQNQRQRQPYRQHQQKYQQKYQPKKYHRRKFASRFRCWLLGVLLAALAAGAFAQPYSAGALAGEYNQAYYVLQELNSGLPAAAPAPNLQTPQAALEFFIRTSREENFSRAAYVLNLNLLPPDMQVARAAELAEQLFYVLDNEVTFDFTALPDRPDGLLESTTGPSSALVGVPRRSIEVATLDIAPRTLSLQLQRVRVGDTAPLWVFSAATVENIPMLYDTFGPNAIDRIVPNWLTTQFFGVVLWEFVAFILLLAVALLIGWLTSRLSRWILDKTDNHRLRALVRHLTVPLTMTIAFGLLFGLSSGVLPFTDAFVSSLRTVMWILFVLSLIWLGIRTIDFIAERMFVRRVDSLGEEQNDLQRQRRTMLSLMRRVFTVMMVLIGIGVMLSQFADLASLGTTLLTSAGVVGVVVGIAARPVLTNLVAGMQVALTQPVRIGDTVMIDGNWSYVEELGYTYATMRTWDERRLLVPMYELVTERIENWSHTERQQAASVYIYVDYHADIAAVREKFLELVKDSELWSGIEDPEVIAYGFLEDRVLLRGKASASSPGNAWTLECNLREQLVSYLQEHPDFLPRERRVISGTKQQAEDAVAASHDAASKQQAEEVAAAPHD